MEYKSFIGAIEHGIESRTNDNRDHLQFLLRFTSGQPHELVKSCIHMEPSAGYTKAKQMLKEFFGDDFKIAEAYIKEALDWPAFKPEDGVAVVSAVLLIIPHRLLQHHERYQLHGRLGQYTCKKGKRKELSLRTLLTL